jgi:hypothetical protein
MKKKTFNVGETFYIGDGERYCAYLPKFILDLIEEASSGRASPSQNELFRRVLWMTRWVIEEKGEEVFDEIPDASEEALNRSLEGDLSDLGYEQSPIDPADLDGVPIDGSEFFQVVRDAPWIDLDDLPERRVRERFPFLATHVRIISLFRNLEEEDYSTTPKRVARALRLFMKIDSLKWVPLALKKL